MNNSIADKLGGKIIGLVPVTGGGAFGAAWLAEIVKTMQTRHEPDQGRPDRTSTEAEGVVYSRVPMSKTTWQRLASLAEQSSTQGRKVSPMQIAARILEEALADLK